MIILGGIIAGTITLAFMTPDPRTGDLLSLKPLKAAFANGSILETLQEKTPSRVLAVTGNSAAHVAGKALGSASKVAGPVIDSATEEGKESASSLIPKTNEQKRDAIIDKLEERIEELEGANEKEVEDLKKEMDVLLEDLKQVKQDNNFLQALVSKLSPGEEGCECTLDANQ